MDARWPQIPEADKLMLLQSEYIKKFARSVRELEIAATKKLAKAKAGKGPKQGALPPFDPSLPKAMKVLVAKNFPAWQDTVVEILKSNYDAVRLRSSFLCILMNRSGVVNFDRVSFLNMENVGCG